MRRDTEYYIEIILLYVFLIADSGKLQRDVWSFMHPSVAWIF